MLSTAILKPYLLFRVDCIVAILPSLGLFSPGFGLTGSIGVLLDVIPKVLKNPFAIACPTIFCSSTVSPICTSVALSTKYAYVITAGAFVHLINPK